MSIEEFLDDTGSTTVKFKEIAPHLEYKLTVLQSTIDESGGCRIVHLTLGDYPVMLGCSHVLKSSPFFMEILKNTGTIPIGVQLFDPKNEITRIEYSVSNIKIADIDKQEIVLHLQQSGYGLNETLYLRRSRFVHQSQYLMLDEYVLPGLIEILKTVKSL